MPCHEGVWWDRGLAPSIFNYSNRFRPLFKKGDRTEFSNYRPISLLTLFSKITEIIISKRLYCQLHDNNILVNDQYGFREKLSNGTATYTLVNNVLSSLDKKKSC